MVKLWHFCPAAREMRREDEGHDHAQVCRNHKREMGVCRLMAIACVRGTNSYAQSDADAVKAAVAAYTAAVDSLDPAKMEAL
jgi:hypothetical protein